MSHFPLSLTWAQILELPNAKIALADIFASSEEGEPVSDQLAYYSEAFHSSPKLTDYLQGIGYEITPTGVNIRNDAAVRTANALFGQIYTEYDDPDARCVSHPTHPEAWPKTTPTWALFELGGDDDVDYCGSMPSYLTEFLISLMTSGDLS